MTQQIPAIRFWLRTIGPACAELPPFWRLSPNPNQPEFRSCIGTPPLRDGPNRRPSGRNDRFWMVDGSGEVNFGKVGCPQDNRSKSNEALSPAIGELRIPDSTGSVGTKQRVRYVATRSDFRANALCFGCRFVGQGRRL